MAGVNTGEDEGRERKDEGCERVVDGLEVRLPHYGGTNNLTLNLGREFFRLCE